jgi:UTP--glucose-1-phosphate uridylyltransferase
MTKCVITAAGKGTRLLPFTKELPKEMMPIFTNTDNQKKVVPLLQLIFEQMYENKLREYCFIVGREKRAIEDHFTPDNSYVNELSNKNKKLISYFYKKIENSHLTWINQHKPLGFGDAVRKSEKFVGSDDFIVHAGDAAIIGKNIHPINKFLNLLKKNQEIDCMFLCKEIIDNKRFGVPEVEKISKSVFKVLNVKEKPTKPKSNLAILPIYYFKPSIFEHLKKIKPGKGGEYQLTDAIQSMIKSKKNVLAIKIDSNEKDLDVGTVESFKYSLDISYKLT